MKRIPKLGILFVCLVVALLLPTILSTSASGPMITMPVYVLLAGRRLTPDEIQSVRFIFSEKTTSELVLSKLPELQEAQKADWGQRIGAPFSIIREGLQFPQVTPKLRSVYISVTAKDGRPLSFCFPVFSTTDRNSPIVINLPD